VRRLFGLPRWAIVAGACAGLSLAGFGYAWTTPSGYYAFLPDPANPADEAVIVPGERHASDDGGIYFVDISVLQANLVQEFWARHFADGATLVPSDRLVAPGESDGERRRRELKAMATSQEVAQVVAARALGRPVDVEHTGALVAGVEPRFPAAAAGIHTGDVVTRAGGRPIRSAADLLAVTEHLQPGDPLELELRRGRDLTIRTTHSPDDPDRAVIGISVADSVDIGKLPINVRFSVPGIGGPSAGLAFALEIYDSLTGRRLAADRRVAVTGELDLDGGVHGIGGVRQKVIGALDAGADIFLVPAGDNYRDARDEADGRIRVVPVKTFDDALRALGAPPVPSDAT